MDAPLAERLRPQNLDEFLGQNKILGQQSLLRKSLENDSIPSMIFWGPPGCGKTSLAHVIRQHTKKRFVALSAVAKRSWTQSSSSTKSTALIKGSRTRSSAPWKTAR